MKITLFFCYCLFLPLPFLSPSLYARSIKVTTWNTEWLLSLSDRSEYQVPKDVKQRSGQDFVRLAYYINRLDSDIIALQEVGSIETAEQIIPKNQYDFFISQDKVAQHPVLAIRKTVPYHTRQNPDLTALNPMNLSHPLRSGLDITLYDDKTSIRILVIHLKSQCQDQPLTAPPQACHLLKQQQAVLRQWIQDRIKEKQAFIIMGDFNRILSIHDGFFQNLSASLILPTNGLASPCWGGNYFIDGFILDPLTGRQVINHSLRVMVYKEKEYEMQTRLSDHCPVSIRISLP